jgi:hypothetical protein
MAGRAELRRQGRAKRSSWRWLFALPLLPLATADCYSRGDGAPPPIDRFYFPVGLQVSHGGSVLYAVNSDFDLQYNGGTIQSYDLRLIRRDALRAIADPRDPRLPLTRPGSQIADPCASDPPADDGSFRPLGEASAPPVNSRCYFRDGAIIGAFATDLLLSRPPSELVPQEPATEGDRIGNRRFDRLFAPVRGNATLTWVSVERDAPDWISPDDRHAPYAPFVLGCGQAPGGRCDAAHQAGGDPGEPGNTRRLTMPGEPFGVAMSQDGQSLVVTHQAETKTSLFTTGLRRDQDDPPGAATDMIERPAIQFVLDDVPFGGVGVTAALHDRDAFLPGQAFPRSAFLHTSRAVPEISLLRYYPDEAGGAANVTSSLRRPFLDREATFPITVSAGGTDSRSIIVDPTPRLACKARLEAARDAGTLRGDYETELLLCARRPARLFVANRTPASLLVGELGSPATTGDYDPDLVTLHSTVPLTAGPSKIYLAPIVDRDGAYALRVFVLCFDSATVFIYDPDIGQIENVLRVGPGPFAMAFDPFSLEDVAAHRQVPMDVRDPEGRLRRYRFGYLASFTQSFLQLVDLDNAQEDRSTFERVVFTLGLPTNPKGT